MTNMMIPTWGLCSSFLCATFWGSCLKVAVTSILISKSLTQPSIHSIPINFIFLSNSKWVQNISSGSLGTSFWKSFIVTLNNSFPVIFQSVSLMLDKLNCLTAHCSQCLTCKTDLNMINVDFDFFRQKHQPILWIQGYFQALLLLFVLQVNLPLYYILVVPTT